MSDEKGGWKQFQNLSFDSKSISKRAQKASRATTTHAHKFVLKKLGNIRHVRQYITTWFTIVAVLISAIAVQAFWFQEGYKTQAAAEGGTYAEAVIGPINTLNPLYAQTEAELSASRLIFSALFDYDKTGHLRENVAKSIKTDDTKQIYTVTLREDVLWHDGTHLTANDVAYTVNTMKNPEARATMKSTWESINVSAVDTHTVRFTLPAPYASFPHALTFSILPQHILGMVASSALRESTFSISPVGSGPFSFRLLQSIESRDAAHKIVHLNRWGKYHRGAVKLDRFELHAYDSRDGILHALKAGDVNAAADVTGIREDVPRRFMVISEPVNNGVFALFNLDSPTLKETVLRQALQRGTDTTRARKAVSSDELPLDLPFPAYQLEEATVPQKPSYDRKAALAALDAAGWKVPQGKSIRYKATTPLILRVATIKDQRYEKVLAELTRQWTALGIQVQSIVFDPSVSDQSFAQAVLQPREYDVLINELVIGGDADVYAYWHSSQAQELGFNFANYKNNIVDDILTSARGRSERELRAQKYRDFAERWLKDAPAIALYQPVIQYAYTYNIHSLQPSTILPSSIDRYSNVQYWTAESTSFYKTP
ncbi:MAG: ABC transporter substrate-binding protein [Candidatus Saccharimonadales bacterium]